MECICVETPCCLFILHRHDHYVTTTANWCHKPGIIAHSTLTVIIFLYLTLCGLNDNVGTIALGLFCTHSGYYITVLLAERRTVCTQAYLGYTPPPPPSYLAWPEFTVRPNTTGQVGFPIIAPTWLYVHDIGCVSL